VKRAYKYRIYPTEKQQAKLAKHFGCVRFVWNKYVECFKDRQKRKSVKEYRQEFEFLKEVSAAALQQKERDYIEYLSQFFNKKRKKRLGKPQFKTRKNKQSFRLPNQKFEIVGNKIHLEKIGKVQIVIDRPCDGRMLSVTVSKDRVGDYFVSVLVETEVTKLPKTGKTVGIDLGLKQLITTSDGVQIDRLRENQAKLEIKHIQRRLSKKQKGSNRRNKLKKRLAKLHRKQARKRAWHLHNISRYLIDNYDTIVVEDLNVAGMMKNHKLAGAIGDASWSMLVNMLEAKSKMYGRELFKIDRFFPSSKTCNSCGIVKEHLELSERTFTCECGYEADRDLNAAKNLEQFYTESSLGINACGDEKFMLKSKDINRCSSVKQESNRKTRDYTIRL
jgi:putative transposase